MSRSFKSIVRSVSPFVGKDRDKKKKPASPPTGFKAYNWDLSDVDLVTALEYFYSIKNVQKVKLVSKILAQFDGDEILLLQQLCERHDVGEQEMWDEYLVKGLRHHGSHTSTGGTHKSQLNHNKDPDSRINQFETPAQSRHAPFTTPSNGRSATPNPVTSGKKSLKDVVAADQQAKRSASSGAVRRYTPNTDPDAASVCSEDSQQRRMSSKQFINSLSSAAGNMIRRVSFSKKDGKAAADSASVSEVEEAVFEPEDPHPPSVLRSHQVGTGASHRASMSGSSSRGRPAAGSRRDDKPTEAEADTGTGPGSEHYRRKQELLSAKRAANHNQPVPERAPPTSSSSSSTRRPPSSSHSTATTKTQFEQELMQLRFELHTAHTETTAARREKTEVVRLFAKYVAAHQLHYRESTHRQHAGLYAVHCVAFSYLRENYREFKTLLLF